MLDWLKELVYASSNEPSNNALPNNEPGIIELRGPKAVGVECPAVDLVFIHDLTEDREAPWMMPHSTEFWVDKLLPDAARILIYAYNCGKLDALGDFLDHQLLERRAKDFLSSLQDPIHGVGKNGKDDRPVIFFAHGYGGLLYEQAIVLAWGADVTRTPILRRHGAFLFDTPHLSAGLAEWAVLSATKVSVLRGETAQSVHWGPWDEEFCRLSCMQNRFRTYCQRSSPKLRVAGCFATSPLPNANLSLSSEWALFPEFRPIAVIGDHFSMTKLRPKDEAFNLISTLLRRWVCKLHADAKPRTLITQAPGNDPTSMSAPIAEAKAPRRFYRLPLSMQNAIRGTIRLGSFVRMRESGGPIFVCAVPETILPGNGHIESSAMTRVNFDWIHAPADDLRLWYEITEPLRRHQAQFQAKSAPEFQGISTEEWQPDEAYRTAALGVTRAPLENWNERAVGEPYREYLVTYVKKANGAAIPHESKGLEKHVDFDVAADVRRVMTRHSLGDFEDIVMAFAVQELS
ncbi:uncharacterized protein B0T15DRAFT_544775 [Chaetomium strumarium]|uniref:Uncharacterized protein n=1 Tax=Chaetomium strumarium TaxID=1170767 RepID=A0AAJ0GL02_9PEZI|nr:hypothetical protein B0T15DRAFT_544775 [Chaetomium strumarium]